MNVPPTLNRARTIRLAWWLAAWFLVLGIAVLYVDLPLSRFLRSGGLPGDIRKIVTVSEVFGHGAGIAFILLTLAILVPGGWRLAALPAAAGFGAGALVNLVKLTVARARPHTFESDLIWASFQGWLPWWTVPERASEMGHAWQSFPSGHAATAVSLAWGLSYYFPRGRWLFAFFAALASIQRIHVGAHFPSDVFLGAMIGCLSAAVCLDPRLLGSRLVMDRADASVERLEAPMAPTAGVGPDSPDPDRRAA